MSTRSTRSTRPIQIEKQNEINEGPEKRTADINACLVDPWRSWPVLAGRKRYAKRSARRSTPCVLARRGTWPALCQGEVSPEGKSNAQLAKELSSGLSPLLRVLNVYLDSNNKEGLSLPTEDNCRRFVVIVFSHILAAKCEKGGCFAEPQFDPSPT